MGWSSRPGVRAPTELALWGTVRALVAGGTCPRTADPSLIVRSPRRVAREVTGRGADGERLGAAQLAQGGVGSGWVGSGRGRLARAEAGLGDGEAGLATAESGLRRCR